MARSRLVLLIVGGTLLLGAAAAVEPLTLRVEQPSYRVTRADDQIELRDYAPMIVAETAVSGAGGIAINQGFRAIADYIFGANKGAKKIDMTAPVTQQHASEDESRREDWLVRFTMPRQWTMATLPAPSTSRVSLHEEPARTYAVIRFSGRATEAAVGAQTRALMDYLGRNALKSTGAPILAFFNPPWTLPFLRRNEIMLALD